MLNTVPNDRFQEDTMLIDCGTCVARNIACDDCVVTVLLAAPPPVERRRPAASVEFDEAERAALGRLAEAGLVPPLRLVRPVASGASDSGGSQMPETA